MPNTRSTHGSSVLKVAGIWAALFLVNVSGILEFYRCEFPIPDLNETLYHVKELSLGRIPYRDYFTHHFIGFMAPLVIVSHFTELSPTVVWIVALVSNFINAVLVYLILREISAARVAFLGAFCVVTVGWLPGWTGYWYNVQSGFMPFMYLYLWFLLVATARANAYFLYSAAFVMGLLICCDQRLIPFSSLLLVPLYLGRKRDDSTNFVGMLSFLLFCPCAAFLYLVYHGALYDFFQQTLIFPLYYRNHGVGGVVNDQSIQLLVQGLQVEIFVVTAAFIAWVAMLRFDDRRWLLAILSVYVLCSVVYVLVGGRIFPHYLLILAPALMILMPLLVHYAALHFVRSQRLLLILLIIPCAIAAARPALLYASKGFVFWEIDERTTKGVARVVLENTTPSDEILVWGYWPRLYSFSNRMTSFRDLGMFSVTGGNYMSEDVAQQGIVPEMVEEFKEYLRSNPPRVIVYYQRRPDNEVIPSIDSHPSTLYLAGLLQRNNDFERLPHLFYFRDFIREHYVLHSVIEGGADRAVIYLKNHPSLP